MPLPQIRRGVNSNACPPNVWWGNHEYVWDYRNRLTEAKEKQDL